MRRESLRKFPPIDYSLLIRSMQVPLQLAHGDEIIVRYVGDVVMGFELKEDAELFLRDAKERLAQFGLEFIRIHGH